MSVPPGKDYELTASQTMLKTSGEMATVFNGDATTEGSAMVTEMVRTDDEKEKQEELKRLKESDLLREKIRTLTTNTRVYR